MRRELVNHVLKKTVEPSWTKEHELEKRTQAIESGQAEVTMKDSLCAQQLEAFLNNKKWFQQLFFLMF